MNLLLKNFILDDSLLFSTEHIKDTLDFPHVMSLVVLDLESLAMETRRAGDKAMADNCLSPIEQQRYGDFSYEKRKNEWLGGRISAKIAAAKCMAASDIGEKKPIAWQDIAIESQESGRPFCVTGKQDQKPQNIPDISISHSSGLAAAMAVSRGKCGIDIQQASQKTVKVRERFCTREEHEMLQGFLPDASETVRLTLLWAAKEALRKAADTSPVPGFLELQLMEIYDAPQGLWSLIFNIPDPALTNIAVAVGRVDDYLLAVTTGSDTVE
jgi:phosphopantetheinyl transferase